MKQTVTYFLTFIFLIQISCRQNSRINPKINTQSDDTILPTPEMTGGKSLMLSLKNRRTTRNYINKELNLQQLSNLLWAACGINRPLSNGRTAPSACNKQEIDIYISMRTGTYLYDFKNHKLQKVISEDIRPKSGEQKFIADAPVLLILVANIDKACGNDSTKLVYSSMDAGYVSQNIYLYCASEGLSTVAVASIKHDIVRQKLKLSKNQLVLLIHPVGYSE